MKKILIAILIILSTSISVVHANQKSDTSDTFKTYNENISTVTKNIELFAKQGIDNKENQKDINKDVQSAKFLISEINTLKTNIQSKRDPKNKDVNLYIDEIDLILTSYNHSLNYLIEYLLSEDPQVKYNSLSEFFYTFENAKRQFNNLTK